MDDDTEEYDFDESIRSFRRAATKVTEGLKHLYHGGKNQLADQHIVVQSAITVGLWFAGNWTYNRIAPQVVDSVAGLFSSVRPTSVLALTLELLGADFAFPATQLSGILLGMLVGQTRLQTRRLKRIETKVTDMGKAGETATDGGSPDPETIGGGGLGGAIAGGFAGASFGPGGVLAGAYLGYVLGERLTQGEMTETTSGRS